MPHCQRGSLQRSEDPWAPCCGLKYAPYNAGCWYMRVFFNWGSPSHHWFQCILKCSNDWGYLGVPNLGNLHKFESMHPSCPTTCKDRKFRTPPGFKPRGSISHPSWTRSSFIGTGFLQYGSIHHEPQIHMDKYRYTLYRFRYRMR